MIKNGWFVANDYTYTIPEESGCYAIYTLDYYGDRSRKLVYIGTAVNLAKRLKKHEIIKAIRCLSDYFIVIKCKIIDDNTTRFLTEAKLIRKLKPRGNMVGING